MSNIPDIIIRTLEEREAEKAAEESARVWLGEIADRSGIRLDIYPKAEMEVRTARFWGFADKPAAIVWASLRAKELSLEGVEIFSPHLNEIILALPDERVSRPLQFFRRRGEEMMLEW